MSQKLRRIHGHVPLALLGLLLARPAPLTSLAGSALVLAGIALRIWAAGLLVKGGELCTDGPYRFLRHPLYLGSLIAAVGFAIMMNVIWGWVIILPLFIILYTLQVLDEERRLRALYGAAHEQYARIVPMLLPRPWKPAAGAGRPWQWSRALANREQWHILTTLILVTLFLIRERLG